MIKSARLIQALHNHDCIAIYPWPDRPTKLLLGFVLYHNENWIALDLVNPEGEEDGVFLCSWSQVFRIETGTRYNKEMANGRAANGLSEEAQFSEEALFHYAVQNNVQVSVMRKEGQKEIRGVVDDITSNALILRSGQNGDKRYEFCVTDGDLAYLWFEVPISKI